MHGRTSARRRAKLASFTLSGVAVASLAVIAWAGTSLAASAGGYQSSQQDCQPYASDWATPTDQIYPGCHNTALNVESGGTTNGVANPDNTQYVNFGIDQAPNDPNSVGTPGLLSVGEPGMSGSPHAGCAAVNTDGTNSGPAPAGVGPENQGKAVDTQYGCASNPAGTGFETNFDYYDIYCPVAQTLMHPCEDTTPGTTSFTPDTGTAYNLTPIEKNGVLIYLGEDDNLDNGEHDGLGPFNNALFPNDQGAVNGPSDGGALTLSLTPQNAKNKPSLTNPEGLLNASGGGCADGICFDGTTQQQTVYQGCNAPDSGGYAPCDSGVPNNADVYDYTQPDPSLTESPNCNGGGPNTTGPDVCGPGGMNALRSGTPANENTEPGIQLYADPDSQRSPALPSPLWPTPALYIGTCGFVAGSAATTGQLPATPITNSAGQLAIMEC